MNITPIKIKNEVFNAFFVPYQVVQPKNVETINSNELLNELRKNSKDITEVNFGTISSFNFNRKVFESGKWNDLSKFARGLFVNIQTGDIVARGYDKFFNYKEGQFNSKEFLMNNLKFPVYAYEKYNGFLGLLGFDKTKDSGQKLVFCSKSSLTSTYVDYFKQIFYNEMKRNKVEITSYIESLENYLDEHNLCLIFEVIDVKNDPHIIKYSENKLVLLAALKRQSKFEELNYDELKELGKMFNWNVKKLKYQFNNFNEVEKFIDKISNDYESEIEGFVFEDQNKYMFKLKGGYYNQWKLLRKIKIDVAKRRQIRQGNFQRAEINYFYAWLKNQDADYIMNTDIISLREQFKKENNYA